MASTSVSSSSDLCVKWTALADDQLTVDNVKELLAPVRDDLWVAAACVDRVLEDTDVERSVIDLGAERTLSAADRIRKVYDESIYNEDEGEETGPKEERQRSLVAHFQDEPVDAQLCRIRTVLLDRLDRLNTYVEICKIAPVKEDGREVEDGEWEDDPWADPEESSEQPSVEQSGEPPLPLSVFLTTELLELACLLASEEHYAALHILMTYHGHHLWAHRFTLLECIPEHALATEFRDLLPAYDALTERELKPQFQLWRSSPDFSETSVCQTAISESGVPLPVELPPERATGQPSHPEPLSSGELAAWYQNRIDFITSSAGLVDASLLLTQHAASQGIPQLDALGEELSLLSRLVYDAPLAKEDADADWTISKWKSLEPPSVVRAYLAHSTPETVVGDINRLVMPYLFVLESRAERAGEPDPSLPTRLLYDYILQARLDIVAAIFEASKPTLSPGQRIIKDDEDMARIALACLYGSSSVDEWPTMSRIFECLPAWASPGEGEDEADEAETTIASLGAYCMPSTTRPVCGPSDLMLFFKPLPSSALSRALDVLDVHLESGEILARWGVPAPLRWFLRSNDDITEQRARANRIARQASGAKDKLETHEDWEWLLEDMVKLSGDGESGSRSAFCLLSKDDIVRIFYSGLLSSAKFDIAKTLLRSRGVHLSLDPRVIEDICLSVSQELYENASSGNYHFGEMKLAYDCLDIPAPSDRVIKEKDFIEATSRLCSFNLMSRSGVPISPLEIRLTKDRLSLISRVLASNIDAYKHTQVILELVHKLGFKGDTVAEVKTLAMLVETALQADDFDRAYETSEKMIDTVLQLRASVPSGLPDPLVEQASEVCWVACFQLGRHPEYDDVQKKLTVLGRALQICPSEHILDVLAVWRRVEQEDMEERRERLAAQHTGDGHTVRGRKRVHAQREAPSLTERLQHLRMPDLHMGHSPLLGGAPDAAAFAGAAFNRVAANFTAFGGRGRSIFPGDDGAQRSGSGSRTRGADGGEMASRVLQKGIGWLLGADDE